MNEAKHYRLSIPQSTLYRYAPTIRPDLWVHTLKEPKSNNEYLSMMTRQFLSQPSFHESPRSTSLNHFKAFDFKNPTFDNLNLLEKKADANGWRLSNNICLSRYTRDERSLNVYSDFKKPGGILQPSFLTITVTSFTREEHSFHAYLLRRLAVFPYDTAMGIQNFTNWVVVIDQNKEIADIFKVLTPVVKVEFDGEFEELRELIEEIVVETAVKALDVVNMLEIVVKDDPITVNREEVLDIEASAASTILFCSANIEQFPFVPHSKPNGQHKEPQAFMLLSRFVVLMRDPGCAVAFCSDTSQDIGVRFEQSLPSGQHNIVCPKSRKSRLTAEESMYIETKDIRELKFLERIFRTKELFFFRRRFTTREMLIGVFSNKVFISLNPQQITPAIPINMPPQNRAAWLMKKQDNVQVVNDAPYNKPEANELVIRVMAVAINPADVVIQKLGIIINSYPAILGCDAAGIVEEVGSDINDFKPGDHVIGATKPLPGGIYKYSGFQQYTVLKMPQIAKIPDNSSFTDATVLPLGGKDKTLLIWGASSSLGCCGVQLATAAGYEVIGVASKKNHLLVKSLGATQAFDQSDPDVVVKIIAALKGKTCVGAFDPISKKETLQPICEILHESGAKKLVAAVAPGAESLGTNDVIIRTNFANAGGVSRANEHIWRVFLEPALTSGAFLYMPQADIVGHGLEDIQKGCDLLAQGVSAKKLVISLTSECRLNRSAAGHASANSSTTKPSGNTVTIKAIDVRSDVATVITSSSTYRPNASTRMRNIPNFSNAIFVQDLSTLTLLCKLTRTQLINMPVSSNHLRSRGHFSSNKPIPPPPQGQATINPKATCHQCDAILPSFSALIQHFTDSHMEKEQSSAAQTQASNTVQAFQVVLPNYSCSRCGENFNDLANFDSHIKQKHELKCDKCTAKFDGNGSLEKHQMDAHSFRCDKCSSAFNLLLDLQRHQRSHAFKCDECPAKFDIYSDLLKHQQDVHWLRCEKCSSAFNLLLDLQNHQRQSHPKPEVPTFKYQKCSATFHKCDDLDKHRPDAHEFPCKKCPSKFDTLAALQKHLDVHVISCEKCPANFNTRADLGKHQLEAHNFTCNKCSRTFDSLGELQTHDTESHQRIQMHTQPQIPTQTCIHCKAKVMTSDELENHISSVHKFDCRKCNKSFFNMNFLWGHIEAEHLNTLDDALRTRPVLQENIPFTGNPSRPVTSSDTSSGFSISSSSASSLEANKCPVCKKTFSVQTELTSHRASSLFCKLENVRCAECPMTFSNRMEFFKHKGTSHPAIARR
ncbi:hypothetical protein G7Y89_g6945 [Cudoniella acicularis]|uniref:C2H2-type domain-containing protein n=1 Tax=Cudoniella acicularis TaxID=354080 RepID=A0A8H4RJG5_9HELO|nr:hypothetical protein G7Y89_g6945 [Cudoniella acicularis]